MLKEMGTEFINDENGKPDKVILDYADYVEIAKKLDLPLEPAPGVKQRSPFDWYVFTESVSSILHGLVALSSRETMLEEQKPNPDPERIAQLKSLGDDAMNQIKDNDNFSTLDKMEAIIEKYSPILLAEKKKLRF